MPAVWTTPKTWDFAEGVSVADFNELRDQLLFLKTRPNGSVVISGTTTSTTFVASAQSITLTTYGGNVKIKFSGRSQHSGASIASAVDFAIDGVRQGDVTNGVQNFHTHSTATDDYPLAPYFVTQTPPAAGEHIFELYRKTASGTLTIAGTLYVEESG